MDIDIKSKAKKIAPSIWEIPQNAKKGMNVPVHVYTNDLLFHNLDAGVFNQSTNVATLPGVVDKVGVMPDAHYGYGFPIGGVAAMDLDEGVISPGGIGFDINCGMRLIKTNLTEKQVKPKIKELVNMLFQYVPAGVGRQGMVKFKHHEFENILAEGSKALVELGYAWDDDLSFIEEKGVISGSKPELISQKARNRGNSQLGTLGSGNHFLEIQVIKKNNIIDENAAKAFGISDEDQIVIMVHTGSRGFGHQVASEYLDKFLEVMPKYGINVIDRELAAVPIKSKEGEDYFAAMACAANFAFANRSLITHQTREVFSKLFDDSPENLGMGITYDVCHNIAKFEKHKIKNGSTKELLVHRKGATRSFGPGSKDLPEIYQKFGQPVIIGGSMETRSYILTGTSRSMTEAFGSSAHGSGRLLSRTSAKKQVDGFKLQKSMELRGIYVKGASNKGLAEEAGLAYKDLDDVVQSAMDGGLTNPVVKLLPIGNIKG